MLFSEPPESKANHSEQTAAWVCMLLPAHGCLHPCSPGCSQPQPCSAICSVVTDPSLSPPMPGFSSGRSEQSREHPTALRRTAKQPWGQACPKAGQAREDSKAVPLQVDIPRVPFRTHSCPRLYRPTLPLAGSWWEVWKGSAGPWCPLRDKSNEESPPHAALPATLVLQEIRPQAQHHVLCFGSGLHCPAFASLSPKAPSKENTTACTYPGMLCAQEQWGRHLWKDRQGGLDPTCQRVVL